MVIANEVSNDRLGTSRHLLTILVLLGCLSAHARAADFNGIDLSPRMCVSNNAAIRDQCTAWISGFQAGISANDEKSNMHVCLPKELLGSQAVLIIEKVYEGTS